jgi:hypothetical protein
VTSRGPALVAVIEAQIRASCGFDGIFTGMTATDRGMVCFPIRESAPLLVIDS